MTITPEVLADLRRKAEAGDEGNLFDSLSPALILILALLDRIAELEAAIKDVRQKTVGVMTALMVDE